MSISIDLLLHLVADQLIDKSSQIIYLYSKKSSKGYFVLHIYCII